MKLTALFSCDIIYSSTETEEQKMAKIISGIYNNVHNTSGKSNKKVYTRKKPTTSKRAFVEKKPTPRPGFWR
jgi:hypothetical protein